MTYKEALVPYICSRLEFGENSVEGTSSDIVALLRFDVIDLHAYIYWIGGITLTVKHEHHPDELYGISVSDYKIIKALGASRALL